MRFGPAVRLLIHQHGLNPATITATGPHGTLLKSDVLAVLSRQPAAAAGLPTKQQPAAQAAKPGKAAGASSPFSDVSLNDFRRQFGASLVAAKFAVPHAYQTVDVNLSHVDSIFQSLVTKTSPQNWIHFLRVACLVKSTVKALAAGHLKEAGNINDLAIAFPTNEGAEALITLAGAGKQSVPDIASFLHAGGKGKGASAAAASVAFYASLPEPIILRRSSAIIRPPQIAAVSVTQLPLTVVPTDDNKIKLAPLFSVTLSYDASKIDDAAAASFLSAIETNLHAWGV